ncbi:MAG TPA: DUF3395 domain-containing protein [Candidatus Acidoferrales bacterium]|nr:DUF3395 domain-containing protein [Candidatus Acidoferrales bacterium]
MKASSFIAKYILATFVVAVGLVAFSARVAGQDDAWQMTRADYGHGNQRTDVTDLLRDLLSRGGVNGRIAVNNQTMGGDPAVGQDKSLRIFARNGRNQEHEFDFKEGSFVDAAMFPVRSDDWGDRGRDDRRGDRDDYGRDRGRDDSRGLSIIRGYWGVQGRTANVTDALRSMVRDGQLVLNANNGSLGGDPAPGADKILIVIYRYQGQEQATAVGEGRTLSIP